MPPREVLRLYRDLPGWQLLAAQGWVESRFRPEVVSPAGAAGVSQFMPLTWEWAKEMGWVRPKDSSPHDPAAAVKAQYRFMEHLMAQFHHDKRKALAAYNWGPGNVRGHLNTYGDRWENHLPKETFAYIRQVLAVEQWIGMFDGL